MNKIFPTYKPTGLSSFDMIRRFKKQNNPDYKVGHGGTLDIFASGLLLLLLGKKTKEFDKIKAWKKVYTAGLRLGINSTTQDVEGEFKKKKVKNIPKRKDIEEIVLKIKEKGSQAVPAFSAAKHNGVPLYKLARKNVIIKKEKEIQIDDIEIIAYKYPLLTIRVSTYGGTYIRQIGDDIGKALKTGAFLYFLEREKIGRYSINKTNKINNLKV